MDRPLHTTQNRVCAWEYASDHPRADAAQVELDVLVTDPDGQELTVPAFQAGPGRWGVRYASPAVGRHRFVTRCSDPTDAALHGRAGVIEVEPGADDGNPLYRHGPLRRVTAGARHLQHADGTPFLWLADTWWMGLVRRLRWPEDFQRLAADRAGKGFSVALLVAGLYPDMPPFDARGANEAGFPWSEGFASLNPAWFDAADRRIEHLVELGMVPAIVGSWGYFMQFAGAGVLRRHWRNLIARYGAYPVVWCIAGEALMPFYTSELWDDLYRARIARSEPPSERLLRHQRQRARRVDGDHPLRPVRGSVPAARFPFIPAPAAGRWTWWRTRRCSTSTWRSAASTTWSRRRGSCRSSTTASTPPRACRGCSARAATRARADGTGRTCSACCSGERCCAAPPAIPTAPAASGR